MSIPPTAVPQGPDQPVPPDDLAWAAPWGGTAAPPSEHSDDHWSGALRTRPIPDQAPGMPSPALVG